MHGVVFLLDAIALLCTAAAFGAAIVLYGTWKTRVLRLYTVFVATIAAFAASTTLQNVVDALGQSSSGERTHAFLEVCILALQIAGGIVHVAILPRFIYAINNRHPSEAVERVFFAAATAMGVLAAVYISRPTLAWTGYLLSGLLLSAIGCCIVRMIPWVLGTHSAGSDLDTSRALGRFLIVSAVFLPLFAADVVASAIHVPEWVARFDGASLPAYLIVLTSGSIAFARSRLNTPPLYADDQLTTYCRERFGLTDRETEVIEYVMEGYSVPDLAGVLGIAQKTAEHHLYSAYQKLSVNNRIQLFQTLMAHQ